MSEIPEPKYVPYTGIFGCGINYQRCKEDCYWYREEIDMGAHIPYCTCKTKFSIEPDDCKDCEQYHSKYHPTNADTIRAMSDEKLAEELLRIFASFCEAQWSREFVLDWLRQEKESA